MKLRLLEYLACPKCSGSLRLAEPALWSVTGEEVEQGQLECAQCGTRHPIVRSVPRFVASELYAASFGFQWKKFPTLQLDKFMENDLSRTRLRYNRVAREDVWRAHPRSGLRLGEIH
jgi:uncharacterized protein YbaR (Trm112 family)